MRTRLVQDIIDCFAGEILQCWSTSIRCNTSMWADSPHEVDHCLMEAMILAQEVLDECECET